MVLKLEGQEIPIKVMTGTYNSGWIDEIGLRDDGGGFLITLWTTRPSALGSRGRFCTVIPISPMDYRLSPESNSFSGFLRKDERSLRVFDDYGKASEIETDPKVVDQLVAEMTRFKLRDLSREIAQQADVQQKRHVTVQNGAYLPPREIADCNLLIDQFADQHTD